MFLEINGIKKNFGEGDSLVEVLKGIDLSVEKGEFCVLLGPSGSGKSTLLNIIGGIDRADEGSITINGEKTEDMNEKRLTMYRRKHLGYIFQMYNLIPNLTVQENIEVGAYLSEHPLDVGELIETLGLTQHKHKLPNQLSGGQQQRCAIGRAIVKNPDILLCDEPTGALDYNTFVFAITTSNTIEKEANVIGTLRASGYTRGELIRHYMAMPCIVTLISAVLGNVLGYTVMKNFCAGMYYGSYSLPTYETVWNAEAFLETTVVPVVLMVLINFWILHRKLKLSPLQLLRRDLSRKKKRRAVRLNPSLRFFTRFRIRVLLQNAANYLIMFIGIQFAYMLLMFGLVMQPILEHYQALITDNMIADYQYILNMPVSEMNEKYKLKMLLAMLEFEQNVETENEDAEKFSAYTLRTTDESYMLEDVLLYGIEPDSRYVHLSLKEDEVYVSSAYAEKFGLQKGDTITLKEKYEDKTYTFTITGFYPYEAGLNVFMTRDHLNEVFDLGDGMFGGYFSNTEITDIDEKYIGSVIDLDALTKVSRQMVLSMGEMMKLVCGFAVLIFVILVYLLSKIIIEKNAQSISMTKILGYSRGEIARLYILPTSIMVVLCVLISIPITSYEIGIIWKAMMSGMMTGWLPYWVPKQAYAQMIGSGLLCYLVVAVLELRRISRVPMDMALKNVE